MKRLIRWWYLLFRREDCIKIVIYNNPYEFGNTVAMANGGEFKYLGNSWYYKIKRYNKNQ